MPRKLYRESEFPPVGAPAPQEGDGDRQRRNYIMDALDRISEEIKYEDVDWALIEQELQGAAELAVPDASRWAKVRKEAPGKKHVDAWSDKRNRQYEHIKEQLQESGKSEDEAKEEAARTVNKTRKEKGETKDQKKSDHTEQQRLLQQEQDNEVMYPGHEGDEKFAPPDPTLYRKNDLTPIYPQPQQQQQQPLVPFIDPRLQQMQQLQQMASTVDPDKNRILQILEEEAEGFIPQVEASRIISESKMTEFIPDDRLVEGIHTYKVARILRQGEAVPYEVCDKCGETSFLEPQCFLDRQGGKLNCYFTCPQCGDRKQLISATDYTPQLERIPSNMMPPDMTPPPAPA